MLSREELIERARDRGEGEPGYWTNFADMLSRKKSLMRAHFTQKEWNWYQMAKADLTEAWE